MHWLIVVCVLLIGCILAFVLVKVILQLFRSPERDPLRYFLGSYRNYIDINGKITDGRYVEPHGRFTVQVPPLLMPGAIIKGRFGAQGGSITFLDDLGSLTRIDMVALGRTAPESTGQDSEQRNVLDNNREYWGGVCRTATARTELIKQVYLSSETTESDFFVFKLPQGGTLAELTPRNKRPIPADALRGFLSFIRGGCLFTISKTLNILSSPGPVSWPLIPGPIASTIGFAAPGDQGEGQSEIIERLKKGLLDTMGTMMFPAAAAQRSFQEGLDAENDDSAIAKFTEAIRLQPDFADAYLHRGDAHSNKGDLDRAVADFSEAIRLEPRFAEAYRARGEAYRSQGQAEKAKADLQTFDELSDPEVVRQLFKKHIPEVTNGTVTIKAIARIGGARTKVAVHAADPRMAAVGLCVGRDGMRIKKIVDELNGERIDIVQWNESLQILIPNALQPAQSQEVFLFPRLGRAIVLLKEDQLSLAIGQRGQNVRLASSLVGWDIELMTRKELDDGIDCAENWFRQIPGIGDQVVKSFIDEGLLSWEDITFLDAAQLAEVAGVTPEQAAKIIVGAKQAAARIEQQQCDSRGQKKR